MLEDSNKIFLISITFNDISTQFYVHEQEQETLPPFKKII